MGFSIKEILELLMKRFAFIVICSLMGLCLLFVISEYLINPTYMATVQMYVISEDVDSSVNLNELTYAQKVVTTYINFLQTKVFYKKVQEESGLDYTHEELIAMTTIKAVENTEIFRISVNSHSPQDSYEIVNAMQKIAPELIVNIKNSAKISIVDPVVLPTKPTAPNVIWNTLIGGVIGFILSVLGSLLWELIDVKLKNQEDLQKNYTYPILGTIPNFYERKERKRLPTKRIPFIGKNKNVVRIDNSIKEDTKFLILEAYKSLRTNLRFMLRQEKCKKLIVSSPVPEDGKSTTSTNIGITIAQTGAKVLLVDCDLRKGRLHSFFDLKSKPGVSDILSGMVDVNEAIMNTSHKNLQIIALGSISPNPTELLASTQMEDLIKKLEKEYDYIIIDTPPVNVVSDSLSLVKMSDGVILVVKENATTHPNIITALNKFEFIEANILGFVINGVSVNQGKKSKSQYYYYRSGDNND